MEISMAAVNVGVLHPGAMGISLAASVQNSGAPVYWASEGRSPQTQARAEKYDLIDAETVAQLCETCSAIISICPPHAAEDVAAEVLAHDFKGLYLDANAISPQRVQRIGEKMAEAGVSFVDGSVIGGPAWEPGKTWLYLSGAEAETAAELFSAGPLETYVIGDTVGDASAVKMCFAAYTKGSSALLSAIVALAEALGVRDTLETQWSRGGSDFAEGTRERVRRTTAKAWRFEGEMHEIADTFEHVGLPDGFHRAAAEVYRRTAQFKDSPQTPPLEEVLAALLEK
jgi:3-hydroxyisobutyrate dehydrogenase-like beta-hydroxyacid dehydrogenase